MWLAMKLSSSGRAKITYSVLANLRMDELSPVFENFHCSVHRHGVDRARLSLSVAATVEVEV
jgi:hypothetical protein